MKELASKLQEYLSVQRKNESIIVEDFKKLRLGFETEKYTFTERSRADNKTSAVKYILRMFPDNFAGYGAMNEFTIMDRLYNEGFPVPKVILAKDDKTILGKPFIIMEFIENKVLATYVINAPPNQQEYWMKKFAELLVQLHQIDWKEIVTDRAPKNLDDPFFATDVYINDWDLFIEKYGATQYKETLDWLKKERKNYPAKRLGFVHRDFHFANVLVGEIESLYVVDWTASNVSDIRVDIANAYCIFRMEKQQRLGDSFLEYYKEISGEPIGKIAFYEVFRALELILFCMFSIEGLDKESENYERGLKHFKFWLSNLYEYLVEITQIRIPEIEKLLE
jgi:aminoglycoside phosphotransferase (APT) family kinase protein